MTTPNFPSFLILPPMRRLTHEGWLHLVRVCTVRLDSTALNYPWPLALKKTRQEWPPTPTAQAPATVGSRRPICLQSK